MWFKLSNAWWKLVTYYLFLCHVCAALPIRYLTRIFGSLMMSPLLWHIFQQLFCNVSYHSQILLLYQLHWWTPLKFWLLYPVINIISAVYHYWRSLINVQSEFYGSIKNSILCYLNAVSFECMVHDIYCDVNISSCLRNHLQCEQWFRYQIADDWPYQEARRLFKEPLVSTDDEELNLKWSPPDEEVITILFENLILFQSTRIILSGLLHTDIPMFVCSLYI